MHCNSQNYDRTSKQKKSVDDFFDLIFFFANIIGLRKILACRVKKAVGSATMLSSQPQHNGVSTATGFIQDIVSAMLQFAGYSAAISREWPTFRAHIV